MPVSHIFTALCPTVDQRCEQQYDVSTLGIAMQKHIIRALWCCQLKVITGANFLPPINADHNYVIKFV